MISCQNCNTNLLGKYCYNCGQSANTRRLDFHSIKHDIQHGLLHFDKGIFFTAIELFKRPGHTIRDYLAGKRVKHFKPISLVILLATIYALLHHFLKIDLILHSKDALSLKTIGFQYNLDIKYGPERSSISKLIIDYADSHFALLQIVFLPFLAGSSWLAFRKAGYSFFEHLVINAFMRGQAIILAIIVLPFLYFGVINREIHTGILQLLQIVFIFWTFRQLFNDRKKWWVVKKSILVLVFLVLEILSIILIIVLFLLAAELFYD